MLFPGSVFSDVLLNLTARGAQPEGIESKSATGGIGVTRTVCFTLSEQFELLTVRVTLKSPTVV